MSERSGARKGPGRPPAKASGFAFGTANYALFAAAAAAIVGGYVLLGRGSVTAAPFLLVLGYLVLIPAAFLVRLSGRNEARSTTDRTRSAAGRTPESADGPASRARDRRAKASQ